MTNEDIIFAERMRLVENGTLQSTGRFITVVDNSGTQKVVPEPEELHTYAYWKSIGYQVRKGQKSLAILKIWMYKTKKQEQENEEEKEEHAFLKTSFFFAASQVEPIKAK